MQVTLTLMMQMMVPINNTQLEIKSKYVLFYLYSNYIFLFSGEQ
jgi:hypothetical protein